MEERKEEGEAEIQEHGPEHWFSKWERQCLAEAEQDEQLPPELQEEAAAAAQPEHKQQKLWHLFQNSATAVAQLYKGEGRRRHLAAAASAPTLGREPRGRLPGSGRRPAAPSPQDGGAGGRSSEGGTRGRPVADAGVAVFGGGPGDHPLLGAGTRAPPGRGGQGRSPQSQNGEGRQQGRPIVPGAGLGAGTEGRLPAQRLSPGLRLRGPPLPLASRRDPLPAILPVTVGSRNP